MSTPEEVQEPKSKVPPMPPKQADSAATAERELLIEAVANALCCEHMGALPGAYSLTHEKDCAKGSESAYMWKSARVAVEAMTAHCAAATAKERQARQLAEGKMAAAELSFLTNLVWIQGVLKKIVQDVTNSDFDADELLDYCTAQITVINGKQKLAPAPAGGSAK